MFKTQRQTVVNAPAERVFSYLADFGRHGDWDGDARLEIKRPSPWAVAKGSTCEWQTEYQFEGVFGGERDIRTVVVKKATVVEYSPNKKITFERKKMTVHGFPQEHDFLAFELEPANGGTRVTAQAEEIIPRWLWPFLLILLPLWPIGWPAGKLYAAWAVSRYLRRIKDQLES